MNKKIYPIILLIFIFFHQPILAANGDAFDGRKLFTSYCQLCHGKNGKGDGTLAKAMKIKPADLTTTVRSRSDTILKKIITGRGKQTITGRDRHNILSDAMPEWNTVFNDSQIDSIIAYLRFLSRSRHQLMGDPNLGKKTYQTYCAVCHGKDGDGDGIMTNLIGITPTDHTNPINTNKLSNQDLIQSIQKGKGRFMPAWDGILNKQEVAGLVSYIRLLGY
ncbi:MAG: hypothetical protein DRQ51_01140 [Gammaproteobacteria bacterium]|nr:MAG: hypothetical protein DRQ51_01140 [Gammaproteobacteria bacterium]